MSKRYEYEDRDEGMAWHTKALSVLLIQLWMLVVVIVVGLWDLSVIVARGLRDLVCYLWPKQPTDQDE